uniref:Glycylpeptide N-tetradecanoyltransferase n=1 Tax=Eubosmina coregoni TaxID=186181 RepID=A0A4Y7LQY3_9CRUS|nr:EOG090X055U [Eubosmina coregoni]SVE69769.1 EOG090X055U [Eubosmina coregoni]
MADKVEADTENTITSANGCDDNSTEHHSNDASASGAKSKDKKKKGKSLKPKMEEDSALAVVPPTNLDLKKAMELLSLSAQSHGAVRTTEDAMAKQYEFWSTQPVPKINEDITANEAIEQNKPLSEIRPEPYSLPPGFVWDTMTLDNPQTLQELYQLLNENYVEDDDNMFRFDYSADFLLWALKPPGWHKEWHCGVRAEKSGKLLGFISAIPATIRIYNHTQKMVEINFLCVHKKLRSKRVAPVLIREITRRVHLKGIFQAVYTAGVVLPKPVSTCRYWHRSLNPKKLIDVKFSHLARNMTMQRTLKLYRLPEETKTPGFRVLEPKDIDQAYQLLNKYLSKFHLAPSFDEEDFRHWFYPRAGIVDCYVVEQDGIITDLVSYYTLPSTVMHHPVHKSLKAAYSFYNASSSTPWQQLMGDALVTAKNAGFDVFNALDLMDNKTFLEPLKFGIGDGNLHYYLYNWRCPQMQAGQVGLVLQ